MKIALTIDSFVEGQGGVSTAVAALARTLRERGQQVLIYTAADATHETIDLDVVGLRALRYERFPGGRVPLAPIRLIQELSNFAPDVIHNHSMSTMGFQALIASSILGIPIIGTCHVFLAGFLNYAPISLEGVPLVEDVAWRYTTAFFNRFPHVTTPSEVMRRCLISHGLHMPISVISNGVNTNLFCPKEKYHSNNKQPFTLLHVGRLSREKQIDVVIRAFARLSTDYPQVHLLIIGVGPEESDLRSLATDLGVSDRVDFAGFISHDQLPSYYSEADLFATASTIETQGLVALEAMACGLAVIGVDAMALPDLIQHEINGYLVPPEDETAFAAAIEQFLLKPELLQVMGRAASRQAQSHSLNNVAIAYEQIYMNVRQRSKRALFQQSKGHGPSMKEVNRSK
ncbi:MAG TPA: glycosyltransferase family 4 protein [Anaerolineae bacterium]|nr:glycosyltransferase family 4 protein [Anaerolineae bacterium]